MVLELAAAQHGAISRRQVLDSGGSDALIRRRRVAGRWVAIMPGVYVIAGSPSTEAQAVWVALLAVGPTGVVSHETAGGIHGFAALPPGPISLTDRHGRHHRREGVVVHQLDDHGPGDVRVVAGMPITSPARTVVDLAATLGVARLRRVVDEAHQSRTASSVEVALVLMRVARRGKPGIRPLASILDERTGGRAVAESELERRLLAVIRAALVGEPESQHPLPGSAARAGLVDFAFPAARLILEADGRRSHTRVADLARDRQRDLHAARAGWQTLRFAHEDLVGDPEDLSRAIGELVTARTAGLR